MGTHTIALSPHHPELRGVLDGRQRCCQQPRQSGGGDVVRVTWRHVPELRTRLEPLSTSRRAAHHSTRRELTSFTLTGVSTSARRRAAASAIEFGLTV